MRALRNRDVVLGGVLMAVLTTPVLGADGEAEPSPAAEVPTLSPPSAPTPGRYRVDRIGPGLTFEVGAGWTGSETVPGDLIALYADEESTLVFSGFNGEVWARPCYVEENDGDYPAYVADTTEIEVSAEALIEHLEANPYLDVGPRVAVEIGGHPGIQVDFTVAVGPRCTLAETNLYVIGPLDDVPADSFPLFIYHTSGGLERLTAIDIDGDVVLVSINGPEEAMPALIELATPVIESIEFATDAPA